jgi:6-phosphogluconate dehydrogenase-like protein
MITPSQTTIGWIGIGLMGAAMCGHLHDAGYRLTVHSRSRAKAQPLLDRNAKWADSPQAVATFGHGRLGTHALSLALEELSYVTVGETRR